MPTPNEVQRKAKKVRDFYDEVNREKAHCQGVVYNSTSWWQSEAGKVLRSEYSEIQADITRVITKLDTLERSTNRLSKNIQQADDERRRKAKK